MLKYLLSLLCISIFAVSCLKNSDDKGCPYTPSNFVAPDAEIQALATYLDTNDIEAVKHPNGFFYKIVNPGAGTDSLGLCTQIQINYTGTLITDSVFDKQANIYFVLGSLIEGWKMGIPLIKRGGEIKLYIPPSLGYGNEDQTRNGVVVIPKNSILQFDVKLIDYRVY